MNDDAYLIKSAAGWDPNDHARVSITAVAGVVAALARREVRGTVAAEEAAECAPAQNQLEVVIRPVELNDLYQGVGAIIYAYVEGSPPAGDEIRATLVLPPDFVVPGAPALKVLGASGGEGAIETEVVCQDCKTARKFTGDTLEEALDAARSASWHLSEQLGNTCPRCDLPV